MIRIALCEPDKAFGQKLRAAIEAYLRRARSVNIEVVSIPSYARFGEYLSALRENFFDLALCRVEADGSASDAARSSVTGALRGLQERAPKTRFVMMSSKAGNALCAYDANVAFVQLPMDSQAFERVVGAALDAIVDERRRLFAVKSLKGASNMSLSDVTFVEMGKKGPVIHVAPERAITTRGTLQALYERLSAIDDRFKRAGGSLIINLDNVRSIGDGSVIFGNGETIILPTRARKPIREDLEAYRAR